MSMNTSTFINYIKAHRKKWQLSQRELGFLLGYDNNASVSHIEHGEKKPSASDLISLELLFKKPASQLFPDIYHDISYKLLQRLRIYEEKLSEESDSEKDKHILGFVQKAIKLLNKAKNKDG